MPSGAGVGPVALRWGLGAGGGASSARVCAVLISERQMERISCHKAFSGDQSSLSK